MAKDIRKRCKSRHKYNMTCTCACAFFAVVECLALLYLNKTEKAFSLTGCMTCNDNLIIKDHLIKIIYSEKATKN